MVMARPPAPLEGGISDEKLKINKEWPKVTKALLLRRTASEA